MDKVEKRLRVIFISSVLIINVFLTYFFYYSRAILERTYQSPLPTLTQVAFKICFLPLVLSLFYVVKFKKMSADGYKNYLFIVLFLEFIILAIFFVAYLYPAVFCSSATLI